MCTQPSDGHFITKQGATISLHWHLARAIPASDEAQMKEVFVDAFCAAYRASGAYTNQTDQQIQDSLAEDFDKILHPNLHSEKPQIFLAAKSDRRMVGYSLFEMLDARTAYIAELAITPLFWNQGLGKKLTFAIVELNPGIEKIVLVTERINKVSQAFYERMGFRSSEYEHEGYPKERFCAYEIDVQGGIL